MIKDCLTEHIQRVQIDDQVSLSIDILSGVPKESVLEPLLFILYLF